MRVGIGYDIHRLVKGRRLIVGGVEIPHNRGLDGHSDADVLLHAICDALFGAAGKGDIGIHFPDNEKAFKDISSIDLLRQTWEIISKEYTSIINIDSTVVAESPKLSPFFDLMKANISTTLDIKSEQINIKATTAETLGSIGKKEGISAMCVVLIE